MLKRNYQIVSTSKESVSNNSFSKFENGMFLDELFAS